MLDGIACPKSQASSRRHLANFSEPTAEPVRATSYVVPIMTDGVLHQINISSGGVPKLPVEGPVVVNTLGVVGDAHNDTRNHGSPSQALCLYSVEVIEALQAEGHPIDPGSAGENLTISGIDWEVLQSGTRLQIGGQVLAELTSPTTPCAKNAGWFLDRNYRRMDPELHPGWSRWYARVITGGIITAGDRIRVDANTAR